MIGRFQIEQASPQFKKLPIKNELKTIDTYIYWRRQRTSVYLFVQIEIYYTTHILSLSLYIYIDRDRIVYTVCVCVYKCVDGVKQDV